MLWATENNGVPENELYLLDDIDSTFRTSDAENASSNKVQLESVFNVLRSVENNQQEDSKERLYGLIGAL